MWRPSRTSRLLRPDWCDREEIITPVEAAITLVGSPTTAVTVSTGTHSASRASVGAGNFLAWIISYFQGGTTSTLPSAPADTNGTINTGLTPANSGTSGTWAGIAIYYVMNCVAGTHALSVTIPNAANNIARSTIAEFSGVALTSAIDLSNSGNASTAQTVSSGATGTLAGANDLVLAALAVVSGAGVTNAAINDPLTASLNVFQNTSTSIGIQHCYSVLSGSTASQSAVFTWTDATSARSQAGIITFKAAAGGAVPFWPLLRRRTNILLRM